MKSYIKIEIKEFIEDELKHLSKRIGLMFRQNRRALDVSKKTLDRRLDEMNEVRAQLDRQVKTFISIERFEGELKAANQKIDNLSKLIYIGLGIWFVLQILIVFILVNIFK